VAAIICVIMHFFHYAFLIISFAEGEAANSRPTGEEISGCYYICNYAFMNYIRNYATVGEDSRHTSSKKIPA
jgi:hypothetical protein